MFLDRLKLRILHLTLLPVELGSSRIIEEVTAFFNLTLCLSGKFSCFLILVVVQAYILILIFGLGSCSWYQTSFEMEWKSHGKFGQKTRGMYIKLILLNVIIFDYFLSFKYLIRINFDAWFLFYLVISCLKTTLKHGVNFLLWLFSFLQAVRCFTMTWRTGGSRPFW